MKMTQKQAVRNSQSGEFPPVRGAVSLSLEAFVPAVGNFTDDVERFFKVYSVRDRLQRQPNVSISWSLDDTKTHFFKALVIRLNIIRCDNLTLRGMECYSAVDQSLKTTMNYPIPCCVIS